MDRMAWIQVAAFVIWMAVTTLAIGLWPPLKCEAYGTCFGNCHTSADCGGGCVCVGYPMGACVTGSQ